MQIQLFFSILILPSIFLSGVISTDTYMPFQQPTTLPPPTPKASLRDTWTQSLITNFLSFNPPQSVSVSMSQISTTSKIYWPPQARFTDHHKQDFSLLATQTSHVVQENHIRPIMMRYRTPCDWQHYNTWKAGWWDAPLTLWDLAKATCMYAKIWFLCQA